MNKLQKFLSSQNTGPDLIDEYITICNEILYHKPITILDVTNKLKNNITNYAIKHSNVYKNNPSLMTRKNLTKEDWFVADMSHANQMFHTSGSSSGEPFSYGVWNKYIRFLEDECHYGMILDEFNIKKSNSKILILKKLSYNPHHKDFLHIEEGSSPYTLHTHKSIYSTRYFVNFNDYMEKPPNVWCSRLLEHIEPFVPFDIVMITGPIMNVLINYLNKNHIHIKIGELFSQTGEFMREIDKQIALEKNYADSVCDHMRCWDGGATFFTCKYNTYHLLDNLSWTTQGSDNKMITTDYFNMSAPFVNYWNGDLCEIGDEYQLCECGRYYRPFKMLENRPFALKGPTKLTEIRQQIKELNFRNKIDQVQFENLSVNIYTNSELNHDEKKILDGVLKDYKANYY